jgi:hypothetical protein
MSLISPIEYLSVPLPSMPFDMDFSNDGGLLACATSTDSQAAPVLRILRAKDGEVVTTYMQATAESCRGVAFLAEATELVFLLQREDGATDLQRVALTSRFPSQLQSYPASTRNHAIVRDQAATHFAVLGSQLQLWKVTDNQPVRTLPSAEPGYPVHAAFSGDGAHLYVYGTKKHVVVRYDVGSGHETGQWDAPTPFGAQLLVTPDEHFLVVVGESYSGTFLYDLRRGERVLTDQDEIVTFDEAMSCTPWATAYDGSFISCQLLAPWTFRLPNVEYVPPSTRVVAPGARCLAAAWAWEAPVVAFGTLEDATVRLFSVVNETGPT